MSNVSQLDEFVEKTQEFVRQHKVRELMRHCHLSQRTLQQYSVKAINRLHISTVREIANMMDISENGKFYETD